MRRIPFVALLLAACASTSLVHHGLERAKFDRYTALVSFSILL